MACVTFTHGISHQSKTVDTDSDPRPYSGKGQPGSLLDIAFARGIDIETSCGGVCACTRCHVIVSQGSNQCNPPSPDEHGLIDLIAHKEPGSRLACQCIPSQGAAISVYIPG